MRDKKEIFETLPVPKALASLALPTILSQLITMIYNLADTFYIGQTGNPYMVAGVSISFATFFVINAISNLFGIGGGSLISRMLGAKEPENAKHVNSFCFWTGIGVAALYALILKLNMRPLIFMLGGSENTVGYASDYIQWVVVYGAVPTSASMMLAHFLRSEGCAKQASIGIAGGGILNIVLDPIFIFSMGMEVKGAAIATMLSNVCSMLYFFAVMFRMRGRTVLSVNPRNYRLKRKYIGQVVSVGFPAAMATLLACVSNSIVNKLSSAYGDIPLAAFGIVKKIDTMPLSVTMGLSQGMLPLIAYNYSAKNFSRMKSVSRCGRIAAICVSAFCIIVFQLIPAFLVRIFIDDAETIAFGSKFLRIACLAVPPMQMNFLLNTTFQAMGKGFRSLLSTICRQGIFNIPLLFLMDHFFGLYGIIWTQLIADSLTLIVAYSLYIGVIRQLHREEAEALQEESLTLSQNPQ